MLQGLIRQQPHEEEDDDGDDDEDIPVEKGVRILSIGDLSLSTVQVQKLFVNAHGALQLSDHITVGMAACDVVLQPVGFSWRCFVCVKRSEISFLRLALMLGFAVARTRHACWTTRPRRRCWRPPANFESQARSTRR